MSRSSLFNPLALAVLASLVATGCDRGADAPKADAPKADAPKTDAPKADAPETPAAEEPAAEKPAIEKPAAPEKPAEAPLAEGWTRLDLSTIDPQLTGTIDVPPGVKTERRTNQQEDADGLSLNSVSVMIGRPACGVSLSPVAQKVDRLASPEAMAGFHKKFEHVQTHTAGPDHWSVVQKWRPGECMSHGWSAAAGLTCDVFKCPCDQMQQWVDVCASLKAGSAPNTVPSTAVAAFPKLEPAAAEVAVKIARAISRDDKAGLAATVGPDGLQIGGKTYKGPALEARLKSTTVLRAVSPEWYKMVEGSVHYGWNADWSPEGKTWVFFSNGYGEQPYFEMKKVGADWTLAGFGIFDHGEP